MTGGGAAVPEGGQEHKLPEIKRGRQSFLGDLLVTEGACEQRLKGTQEAEPLGRQWEESGR